MRAWVLVLLCLGAQGWRAKQRWRNRRPKITPATNISQEAINFIKNFHVDAAQFVEATQASPCRSDNEAEVVTLAHSFASVYEECKSEMYGGEMHVCVDEELGALDGTLGGGQMDVYACFRSVGPDADWAANYRPPGY